MVDKQEENERGDCPHCGPDRISKLNGSHRYSWSDDDSGVSGATDTALLSCRGCDHAFVRIRDWCTEDDGPTINYWPTPMKKEPPKWLHKISYENRQLASLVSNVYHAVSSDLRVLAAIGIRTAFDMSSKSLGVDPNLSFNQKLSELLKLGKIGTEEKDILDTLIDAGSAAAHRGWVPDSQQLDTMTDTMENFLYRTFVLGAEAKRLKEKVPPRNP